MRFGPVGRRAAVALLPLALLGTSAAASPAADRGLTVSGQQVRPTTARGSAPMLDPGLYRAQLPSDDATRFAQIARPAEQTVTVSVVGEPTAGDDGRLTDDQELEVKLVTPHDDECAQDDASAMEDDAPEPLVATAVLDYDKNSRTAYIPDGCKDARRLQVEVSRDAPDDAPAMPVEILVTAEPAIKGSPGEPAGKADMSDLTAPSLETSKTVDGGRGFSTAPTLTEGSVLTDLRLGSTAFYRVRVGWGQRLAVSLEAPRNGSSFAPPYDAHTSITIWSPQRLPVGSTYGGDLSDTSIISKDDGSPQRSGSFTTAVRYANRDAGSTSSPISPDAVRATSVAGWYVVEVTTGPDSDDGPTSSDRTIPARLNVKVTGTPGQGPHYVTAAGAAVTAPPPGAMSIGGDDSAIPWARVTIGAAAVVLAALACLWALRARRRSA